MTALAFCGAEAYLSTITGAVDGSPQGASAPTRDTAVKRTGAASFKCDSGGANGASYITPPDPAIAATSPVYFAVWARLPANPSTAATILTAEQSTVTGPSARLNTNGTVSLMMNSVAQGSASAQALDTTWRQLILKVSSSGGSYTAAELTLDGVVVGTSWTGSQVASGTLGYCRFGWVEVPGASKVINFDDFVSFDSAGATNNSYPAGHKVLWMPPLSDGQIGSWTGGAGGTTNLFEALNNIPPIGTATETDLTQIESADGSPDNATDEYRGNCGSYTTAGVGASDTVSAIYVGVDHGEDVSTGTKTGSAGFQSNPAIAYGTFTYGGDSGALATWPATWRSSRLAFTDSPTVTLGSNLILGLRKTDTGTRVASADLLGAMVLYLPVSGSTYTKAGYGKEHG